MQAVSYWAPSMPHSPGRGTLNAGLVLPTIPDRSKRALSMVALTFNNSIWFQKSFQKVSEYKDSLHPDGIRSKKIISLLFFLNVRFKNPMLYESTGFIKRNIR